VDVTLWYSPTATGVWKSEKFPTKGGNNISTLKVQFWSFPGIRNGMFISIKNPMPNTEKN
jgi:hypothetical protein